jgi:CRP-like cAMP-binding protein
MIVCEGAATLTFSSYTGNVAMLGLSERGEVLGLSSAISGHAHEVSAEALEKTRVAAIGRSDFLHLLERFPAAATNAGTELSRKVNRAYEKIRLIGSGLSVPPRVLRAPAPKMIAGGMFPVNPPGEQMNALVLYLKALK